MTRTPDKPIKLKERPKTPLKKHSKSDIVQAVNRSPRYEMVDISDATNLANLQAKINDTVKKNGIVILLTK